MSQFSEVKKKRPGRPKMTAEQKAEAKRKRDLEKAESPFERPKRPYVQSKVVTDPGIACPHCQHRYDHRKQHKYPNGNQRYICGGCEKPFIVRKIG